MSLTTLGGLILIGSGLFGLLLGRLLTGILVRGYSARNPGKDRDRHERFQKTYARIFSIAFLVAGLAMTIYGLSGGSLEK